MEVVEEVVEEVLEDVEEVMEEMVEEVVEEEGAADVKEVEDGEELRQKILDLEKVIAEKNIENGKLKEVLRQARTHLRMVKEDSEKLNELENVKEENEELVLRLKQSSEKLDDLEVLKEENKELDLRLKQDHEKIENLEAQVTSLHSQKQMESNQNAHRSDVIQDIYSEKKVNMIL